MEILVKFTLNEKWEAYFADHTAIMQAIIKPGLEDVEFEIIEPKEKQNEDSNILK